MPLNEEGIFQAEKLKHELKGVKFDFVFSSPQERAVQTAQIASGTKPIVDERLDSYDLGTADGLKGDEIKKTLNGLIPDPTIYSGVEEVEHYLNRISDFMKDLMKKYKSATNIMICGHKCTTGCISAYFDGMPKDGNFMKLSSPNAGCKIIEVDLKKDYGFIK